MKIIIACATSLEADPLRNLLGGHDGIGIVVTGVGILETGIVLSREITAAGRPDFLFSLGVGGGFGPAGVDLLDICVADREIIADFGVSAGDRVFPFADPVSTAPVEFIADGVDSLTDGLAARGVALHRGPFVSVNAVTASEERAAGLWQQYSPVCENMEGAAVARVAGEFAVPWCEVRCVSNLVGRRDRKGWKISEAAARLGEIMAPVLKGLLRY